jgi:predicted aspartyl protease
VARVWGRYLKLFIIFIIISIPALPSAAAKEGPAPSQSVEGTLRFDLYRGYLMVARGTVGPLKGMHFLLDTGTSTTLLDSRIARKLNVNGIPEDVDIICFKSGARATHAQIPSIEIGPVQQKHVPVLVQDLSIFDDALPVHIDAVIGLDVLGTSPFEVNYRTRRIYFGQLPHLPVSVPLSVEEGLAMVKVELNDTTAHLILDTGTPSLLIFRARIPKAIAGLKMHNPRVAHARGSLQDHEVHLPKIRLGTAEFVRQWAIVVENRDEGGREFDGLLSPAALGIDAFAVDLDRGSLELRFGM